MIIVFVWFNSRNMIVSRSIHVAVSENFKSTSTSRIVNTQLANTLKGSAFKSKDNLIMLINGRASTTNARLKKEKGEDSYTMK